ncbi:MAG TPA: hypothetical protein VK601_22095 [Kofleriaceae bacterium]|nr:hypothetical protein [Kofleriaceae bacterium]
MRSAAGTRWPVADRKQLGDSLGVSIESDMPYVVDSSELMAKCPSKYDGARVNQQLTPNAPQFK